MASSVSWITRLWARGPNAEKILRVLRRFHALSRPEQALLLIGMDIEEGILPLIHPGGRASRREVLCDQRLIAVGDDVDYGYHVTAVLGAASPSAQAAAPGAAEAEAAEASRPARSVSPFSPMTAGEVLTQDRLVMAEWFPQFVLGSVDSGARAAWLGLVRPLDFFPNAYQLLAVYQVDPMSPLLFYVRHPAIHPGAPHRYGDRALCTFFPPSASWIRGRPGDDLVELMRFTIVWLVRYMCWMVFDGWWPGVEVPHDAGWLVANLRDDDFCPYHMPRRWASCCKNHHVAQAARERELNVGIIPRNPAWN